MNSTPEPSSSFISYIPELEQPFKRRVMIVLSRENIIDLLFLSKNKVSNLEDKGITLIEPNPIKSKHNELVTKLKRSALLNPGNVLVQNPHDYSSYAKAENANFEFTIERYDNYCYICQLLGAKTIDISNIKAKKISVKSSVVANLSYKIFKFQATKEQKYQERLKDSFKLSRNYPNPVYQYDKALEQAKNLNLDNDKFVVDILRNRNPNDALVGNYEKNSVQLFEMQSESSLDVVTSLSLPSNLIEAKTQIEKTTNNIFSSQCDIKIEF